MQKERLHRALSDDGTRIVGRRQGDGPPLVLVHGAVADGESEFGEILPHLTDRFTCYTLSTRGRGLSDPHPDHSRQARVRDVAAFVESIGEPAPVLGVSGGGMLALGAAAQCPAISAVAVHEPVVMEVIGDHLLERFRRALEEMEAVADHGDAAAAVTIFLRIVANDEEFAALTADAATLDDAARYLAIDLEEFREAFGLVGESPTEPSALRRITVPVLVTGGTHTGSYTWFMDGARYVADHVPDARVREIAGIGHFGLILDPERCAQELIPFLEAVPQRT